MRALLLFLVAGCIPDGIVLCADGRWCPARTICATLDTDERGLCLAPGDVVACEGSVPFQDCGLGDGSVGTCYATSEGLVCLPGGCGNEILDPDEACDDGNAFVGDGCSASCTSDETCGNGVVDPVRVKDGLFVANESCDDGNHTSHDGCSSTCAPETPIWELLEVIPPDGRFDTGAAFDSDRRRMVVFGGAIQTQLRVARGDTFELDGEGWMKMPTSIAPPARWGAAMAFDPVHHRVVLFGGRTSGAPFDDTWQWDGTRWAAVVTTGMPPPRAEASLVYDPESQRMLLFGGEGASGALGDAWELDGATWTPVSGTLPPARFDHAMAYDPSRNVMVMVSGTPLETWERRTGVWSQSTIPTPAQVANGGLAFDGIGLVAFTNITNTPTGVTLRWDGSAWTTLAPATSATGRTYAAMVTDTARNKVLLFGGARIAIPCGIGCYGLDTTTWEWNGTTWAQIVPEAPGSRTFHAAAFDSRRGSLFFFGGGITLTANGETLNDLWEQRGTHWHKHASGAPGRSHAGMAYDAKRDQLVLVGGPADAWTWRDGVWTAAGTVPSRFDPAVAYDPAREVVVMFGGRTPSLPTDETWVFDGTTWTQKTPTTSPPARFGARMVWDPKRSALVLFGGDTQSGSLADLWAWNGTSWTDITPVQSPPPRASYGMIWHGTRESLLLFAGAATITTLFADTWELDGSTWRQLSTRPPDVRQGHSFTPLADGTGALMFGGSVTSTVSDQLWRLRWDNDQPSELCIAEDTDGDTLAGCADPDCALRCTHCGDGQCTPTEDCALCPMDCGGC